MWSRREWLKLTLAVGGSAAAGVACGDNASAGGALADASPPLCEGGADALETLLAATFEVDPQGALVAIAADRATEVAVRVASPDGSCTTSAAVPIGPTTGLTGVVELAGLAADTDYQYQLVSTDGQLRSPIYRFHTAPPVDAVVPVHLVYAADYDVSPQFATPIMDHIAASGAQFFLSLGDFPYADNAPAAQTVDEYRARHREFRGHGPIQRLHQAMATFAIYDDHEARNNWDAHFRAVEADRIASALAAWDEWFPLRPAPHRYRSWRWGALVEIFLLDTRLYRSADLDPDGPAKTMLGATQLAWLKGALTASTATFKLVATTVPLAFGTDGGDDWSGFATERAELLGFIQSSALTGVLFLTGDQHWFAAHHFASGLIEWQVGPLARGVRTWAPQQPEEVARAAVFNFGEIEVSPSPPTLTFRCRDQDGVVIFEEAVLG